MGAPVIEETTGPDTKDVTGSFDGVVSFGISFYVFLRRSVSSTQTQVGLDEWSPCRSPMTVRRVVEMSHSIIRIIGVEVRFL